MAFALTASRAASLLVPVLLLAQAPKAVTPPVLVDRALRARVTQFLQYSVDGNYRKAYEMVADESKDYYFAASKPKYVSFTIDGIEYSDRFTKATVKASAKQLVQAASASFEMNLPITGNWKLVRGIWMWYHAAPTSIVTPAGEIAIDPTKKGAPSAAVIPKDTSLAAAAAVAEKLVAETSISKTAITFQRSQPASDEVVFHNGANGAVILEMEVTGDPAAFTVAPGRTPVTTGRDLTVKISYDPLKQTPGARSSSLNLTVQPFGKGYRIPITLTEAAAPDR